MSDFPAIDNPTRLKVAELKEELEKRGLPTSGLKKDLVNRLEEAQGFVQPPDPTTENTGAVYPPPALPSTKGDDEDHAKPADEVMDAALLPKDISDTNAPAVSEEIVDLEVAAKNHPEQSHSVIPPKIGEAAQEEQKSGEEGVGHVMVEGGAETTQEIREAEKEIIKSPETALQADLQPAALDSEVAKVIAEEEMKDTIPASPTPMRSASPASVSVPVVPKSESRVNTPPIGGQDEDVLDLDMGEGGKKRSRGEDSAPPPKRPRRQFPPLPPNLSHLVHPPTTCLYISNLRRPLLLPALHEYVFPESSDETHSPLLPTPKGPFASPEYPNVWLSGIKSHAYAVFPSVSQATQAAERIDGQVFPEETGGKLGVEFVDEDEITRLIQREEDAWAGGRQKLDLKVKKEEDGTYRFELQGVGSMGARPGRGAAAPASGPGGSRGGLNGNGRGPVAVPFTGRPPPISGINAMPVGPRGGAQARPPPPGPGARGGFGGRGVPPHLDRDGRSGPNGFGGGGRDRMGDSYVPGGGAGRAGFGDRRTKARPELSWREGPRAR